MKVTLEQNQLILHIAKQIPCKTLRRASKDAPCGLKGCDRCARWYLERTLGLKLEIILDKPPQEPCEYRHEFRGSHNEFGLKTNKLHELKTLPEYFEAKWNGAKRFECRFNDRNFKVGDFLRLREVTPVPNSEPPMVEYTGREIITEILYILQEFVGLQDGYVIMAERIEKLLEECKG